MDRPQKIAVLGAGPSGLCAAWELKHQGYSVDLFEGHSKPGGSASYFKRNPKSQNDYSALLKIENPDEIPNEPCTFDAGATVLWAMEPGELLFEKLKAWGLPALHFEKAKSHRFTLVTNIHPYTFALDCQGRQEWIDSLCKSFPIDSEFIKNEFPNFFKVADELYKILYQIPAEPFFHPRSLKHNLKMWSQIGRVLPHLLKYPRKFSKLIEPLSPPFKKWIEGQIIISLQAKPDQVESLYGILALCFYPLGSGALKGGMMSLFSTLLQNFESSLCKTFMKTKIVKISKSSNEFYLHSENNQFGPYSHVLSSSPRWNSEDLVGKKFQDSPNWEEIQDKLWSANVAYMVFKDEKNLPKSAFNHLVSTSTHQVFYFSVSAAGDPARSLVEGYRTVTVSSHEKLTAWNYPTYKKKETFTGQEMYKAQKLKMAKIFLEQCPYVFQKSPVFLEMASPKTFLHYTGRREGFVGGIPLTTEFSFLNSPSQITGISNLYQIGDTAFPGQSIVNSLVGALEAVRKINQL